MSIHRFIPGVMILLLCAVLFCQPAAAQGVRLAAPGQAPAPIYVSGPIENPTLTPAQQRQLTVADREHRQRVELLGEVVADLAYHLEKMTGRRPEIVVTDDPAAVKAPAIVLGTLAVRLGASPQYETVMQESFRLLTREGRVLIGGESSYGVSHGVYEFLRKLGCNWIFPGPEGEIIPRRDTVTIGPLDLAKKPAFEVRSPWYSGGSPIVTAEDNAQFAQWKTRQQQTHGLREHPKYMTGGHFWYYLINDNRKYLEEHPEMRALIRQPDGTLVRGWDQLDPVHPGAVDLTVKSIREMYKKNGWANDKAIAISIGPNDGGGYSVSPEAMAAAAGRTDPVTGDRDQTDVMILYANRVLKELEDEFPNLYLGWYLYSVHADYPMRYEPHPRFVFIIADITYSRYHSLLDRRSATRTYYRGILEQWAKLHAKQGNPMGFYGYNWNLAENLMPYSKMKIWGQDLPYYHRMGVIGHNNEQDKAWSILGPHNYLMARQGWNIDLDWRDVLKDYCRLAFGDGAPFMEQYYLLLIDTQESAGQEAGSYGATHLIFDQAFIKRSRALFRKASAAAKTPDHKRNVDYFSQPVTALEIYLQYRQAVTSYDFAKGKARYDAMVAHWDAYLAKNPNLVSRYGRRYLDWLFKPYVEQGLKYSTGDYKIVHRIPDALPTILDPTVQGQFMGYFHPEFSDKGRMTTKTFSTTWDAQGLGAYREGAVWYRIRFDLSANLKGQGIGLYLGAVEDEVHVWCNGAYLGSGQGFISPFAFDLTAQVRPGEENVVALQVIRRGMLNEAGLGGLLYPSFVFAGPQLPQVAPRTERLQRILPGGSREDIKE
ncbi:MAG: DUF4838 domain-containing protein [Armatimonadota bacterium]